MTYKFKKTAFELSVAAGVALGVYFVLTEGLWLSWGRIVAAPAGLLAAWYVARPFFERQWPEPKKGWSE